MFPISFFANLDPIRSAADSLPPAQDLINTPANDLGPAELEAAAEALAKAHGASFTSIVGDALLEDGGGRGTFPLIHAVGRAATAARAPRLLDLRWGDERAPKVTLVGKGVCFDTGGLDSALLVFRDAVAPSHHLLSLLFLCTLFFPQSSPPATCWP